MDGWWTANIHRQATKSKAQSLSLSFLLKTTMANSVAWSCASGKRWILSTQLNSTKLYWAHFGGYLSSWTHFREPRNLKYNYENNNNNNNQFWWSYIHLHTIDQYVTILLSIAMEREWEYFAHCINTEWWPLGKWWKQNTRHKPTGIGIGGRRQRARNVISPAALLSKIVLQREEIFTRKSIGNCLAPLICSFSWPGWPLSGQSSRLEQSPRQHLDFSRMDDHCNTAVLYCIVFWLSCG